MINVNLGVSVVQIVLESVMLIFCLIVFSTAAFLAISPANGDLICGQPGWIYHEEGGHCFLIHPSNTTAMTWMDAVAFCRNANPGTTRSGQGLAIRFVLKL